LSLTEIIAELRKLTRDERNAAIIAAAVMNSEQEPTPAHSDGSPKLVEADELARALSYKKSWLMTQARQGKIPSVRRGKYVRFDIDAVAAALRDGTDK